MKKFLIIAAAVSIVPVLLAACSGKQLIPSSPVYDKVEDAARSDKGKIVAEHFKNSISPNNVENDITNIDIEYEMNTEGLTGQEIDEETGSDKLCYYDSDNNLVYELYTQDGKEILDYHTSSLSGRELTVKYAKRDGVWTAFEFECKDYIYNMDLDNLIFNITVYDAAGTISYLKTAETQWTISSAIYDAEDGTHKYTYSEFKGVVSENDQLYQNS